MVKAQRLNNWKLESTGASLQFWNRCANQIFSIEKWCLFIRNLHFAEVALFQATVICDGLEYFNGSKSYLVQFFKENSAIYILNSSNNCRILKIRFKNQFPYKLNTFWVTVIAGEIIIFSQTANFVVLPKGFQTSPKWTSTDVYCACYNLSTLFP